VRAQALGALVLSGSLALAGCSAEPTQAGSPSTSFPAPPAYAVAAAQTTPSCTVPSDLLGRDVERLPLAKKKIALTFDGGSGAQGASSILDTLQARQVPGTFFVTGGFVRSFPATAARIGQEHLVGNHTMTHPDLTKLTDEQIVAEVRKAQRVIRRKTGEDPRRFFRFPYGARNAHTIGVVNDLCYVPFRWTVDTLGWKGTSGGQTVRTVVQRVMAAAQPGAIVLMHLGANPDDGSTLDADALPRIIKKLRHEGYSFVRLSRILPPAP
jgi:peptidoglycan/xylan/chitin deacetylase (PgdA/CDA1 family)